MSSPRILTKRALNRALLERQLLLRRRRMPSLQAVERLVALHSQVPRDPYVALWSRVEPFRAETMSAALEERRAVRMALLRGTLRLVTARDAVGLRALVQPAIEGVIYGSSPLRKTVGSVDMDDMSTIARLGCSIRNPGVARFSELVGFLAGLNQPRRKPAGRAHCSE